MYRHTQVLSSITVALLVFSARTVVGQAIGQYPDSMYLPVIFYDYKADGSNPAFNKQQCNKPTKGAVRGKLGPDRKPVFNTSWNTGSIPLVCNSTIGDWFWPSGNNGRSTNANWYFDIID